MGSAFHSIRREMGRLHFSQPPQNSFQASVLTTTLVNLAAAEKAGSQSKRHLAKWKELNPGGSPPAGLAVEVDVFERFRSAYLQLSQVFVRLKR